MRSQSIQFQDCYINSIGILVSKKEKEGPLGKYFKYYMDDYYFKCKTFEQALSQLMKESIKQAVNKSIYKMGEIELAVGGDLSNQIFSTTKAIKEFHMPFIGIYAACASGILSLIIGAIYISELKYNNVLAFTGSHLCVSEKQFRYPTEYGIQLKNTSTTTMTGACSIILSKLENKLKITKGTMGKVVDILSTNVNDMGTCMAYAAVDTFLIHYQNNHQENYDLVVTGDLSDVGSNVFLHELNKRGINLKKYYDCGSLLYDNKKQKTNSGGSGCGCIMCVSFSFIIDEMLKGNYEKVLLIGTGALHSQISYQQKETIPCIAHAVVLEVHHG